MKQDMLVTLEKFALGPRLDDIPSVSKYLPMELGATLVSLMILDE